MSKNAKPAFWKLLDGRSANRFDAKSFLAARREVRRDLIPFTPVLAFGLVLDEGRNEVRPTREERGAEPSGEGIQTHHS